MNKKVLCLLLWLVPLFGFSQTEVVVWYYDGTTQTFDVGPSDKMYFANENLVVQVSEIENPVSIPLSIIRKISFGPPNVVGWDEPMDIDPEVVLFPNPASETLQIRSKKQGLLAVSLFSATGQLILKSRYTPNQEIDLAGLSAGLYFITVNGSSFKFVKK